MPTNTQLTRREFLNRSALAASSIAAVPTLAASSHAFSFVLLGDLHFDRVEHHDFEWLRANKPDDVRQVQDYTRITREITPQLFATIRETIADLNRSGETPVSLVLQVGDLVEGLCGTEELAVRQNSEAIGFVGDARLGVPFVFTKGNHDITGNGAAEAFKSVFHPFIAKQSAAVQKQAQQSNACSAFRVGDALYCCFDAYDRESLSWLEATLAKRTERHCFVTIHPPVVPYGARSTWHIYSSEKQKAEREKLLDLLGRQRAFVLGGHIHKYSTLVRDTPRGGRFLQLAVSSIIRAPEVTAKNVLASKDYNPDQIRVEPNFSPATEAQRRAVYETEAPQVKHFEYADLPGYAVVTVREDKVNATIYSGATRNVWKDLSPSALLFG